MRVIVHFIYLQAISALTTLNHPHRTRRSYRINPPASPPQLSRKREHVCLNSLMSLIELERVLTRVCLYKMQMDLYSSCPSGACEGLVKGGLAEYSCVQGAESAMWSRLELSTCGFPSSKEELEIQEAIRLPLWRDL